MQGLEQLQCFFLRMATVTLTWSQRPESWTCSRYYHTNIYVKLYQNPLINVGTRAMTRFFSKNSHSYLDLEPSNLTVELAWYIIIPNIYMKLYYNPLINVGIGELTNFSKNSNKDLDLDPSTLKVKLAWDIIIPNIFVKLYLNPSINVGTGAITVFSEK